MTPMTPDDRKKLMTDFKRLVRKAEKAIEDTRPSVVGEVSDYSASRYIDLASVVAGVMRSAE